MNNHGYQHKRTTSVMTPRRIFGTLMAALLIGMLGAPLQAQPGDNTTDPKLEDFKIRNIGFIVNTQDLEYAPTFTADGRTLYFVSDRPGGVGGHDFMFTTKKSRLDTIFAPPENLNPPV